MSYNPNDFIFRLIVALCEVALRLIATMIEKHETRLSELKKLVSLRVCHGLGGKDVFLFLGTFDFV